MARRIQKHLQNVSQRGEPTSFQQVASYYPELPWKANGALVFMAAISKVSETNRNQADKLFQSVVATPISQGLGHTNRASITAWLHDNDAALELLRKGATLPEARYPLNFRQGAQMKAPHTVSVFEATEWLCLAAVFHAERAETDQAVKSLQAALSLGQSLAAEPLLHSHAARRSCHRRTAYFLERTLHCVTFSDPQLSALQESFSLAARPVDLTRVFYWERCFGLAVDHKRLLQYIMENRTNAELLHPFLKLSGRIEADRLFFLEQISLYIECANKPFPERLTSIRQLEQGRYPRVKRRCLVWSARRLTDYEGIMDAEAEAVARLRLAECALAVVRYKGQRGTFPSEIAQLVPNFLPQILADPGDGKPLRIRQDEASLTIYSVGKDMTDNGGRPKQSWQTYDTPYDLCFVLPVGGR